jgi:biopolymer transport protein ExbB
MRLCFYAFFLTAAAQSALAQQSASPAPIQAPANAAADSVKVESVWDLVVKGGPVMVPIGICSLIALTIMVERLVTLRKRKVSPPGFVEGLRAVFGSSRDPEKALEYCRANRSPLANILAEGIRKADEPVAVIEKHVKAAGEREVASLRKNLRGLSVVTAVSPLLGLLGTITGMITAFQTVATSAEALGRTELLAKGIYEAMITTAAGLMVAIPTLIAYHALSAKVDLLVGDLDRAVVGFVEELAGAGEKPGVTRRSVLSSTSVRLEREQEDGRLAGSVVAAKSA